MANMAMRMKPERRTQAQRRVATTRKLLDATTATLVELGYAGTTVQEVCARAGVSQGGLFRHYATRERLVAAAGEDIGERLVDGYRRRLATFGRSDDAITALRLLRAASRSKLAQAWFELVIASRTQRGLRRALQPVFRDHYDQIIALAHELWPEVAIRLGPMFTVLVDTIVAAFDGETVRRFVVRSPAVEEQRLGMLAEATRRAFAGL
jgi:AcrR family transcriptional regulator